MAIALLCIFCVILFSLLVVSVKYNIVAGKKLRQYDEFYNNTIEDMQDSVEYLETLMKRDVVSLDPDVQNLRRLVGVVKDILIGYIDAEKDKK